jgi:hypothetical protein
LLRNFIERGSAAPKKGNSFTIKLLSIVQQPQPGKTEKQNMVAIESDSWEDRLSWGTGISQGQMRSLSNLYRHPAQERGILYHVSERTKIYQIIE